MPGRQRGVARGARAAGRPALGRSRRPERAGRAEDAPLSSGMRFRAVFFDAGETLVHADPSFAELFVAVLADAGHERSVDDVREASHASTHGSPRRRATATVDDVARALRARSGPRCTSGCSTSSRSRLRRSRDLAATASSPMANYVLFDDVRPTLDGARATRRGARHGLELRGVARGLVGVLELLELFPVRVISRDRGHREAGRRDLPPRARPGAVSSGRSPPTSATTPSSTSTRRRRSGCSRS